MSDDVKKLYRTHDDRMIAGVCSGLAAYFNVDVTVIRILFIIFGVFGGSSFLIYLILWILIPNAPDAFPEMTVEEEPEPSKEE